MAKRVDLGTTIDHIVHELEELKKTMVPESIKKESRADRAWDDLMQISDRITKKWKGLSAVEEIRQQREKKW